MKYYQKQVRQLVKRSRLKKAKRKISMKALIGAVKSPKTPARLKEGLIRKYPSLKKYA